MRIIVLMAWRNIWRNKLRTGVLVTSMALGIWAGTFVMAFAFGMNRQRTEGAIRTTLSHIQIHTPAFKKDPTLANFIPNPEGLIQSLDAESKAVTGRTVTDGMVQSAYAAGAVRLLGIDPQREAAVTDYAKRVVEGTWFEGTARKPILVGQALAQKLHIGLKSKVVITFQREDATLVSEAFRVEGLYQTANSKLDELTAFVRLQDVQQALGGEVFIHEIALLVKESEPEPLAASLASAHPELTVETWRDLAPELRYADEVMKQLLYLFVGIILMALAFGLVNNLLMSILERTRELGMMKAVGMNRRRLFFMILSESMLTSLAGGPLGLLLAWATNTWLGKRGISFEAFSTGLSSFGLDAVTYPILPSSYYWGIAGLVLLTAMLASIAPARRALALKPVDALRHT